MKKKLVVVLTVLLVLLGAVGILGYRYCGGKKLPVLMYHHFDQTSNFYTVVSEQRFREQMTALKEAGYETVTLRQVYDYVHHRGKLPEKPVLITMDDGYSSNLELAAPILEELDMCATVFVIGICEGETVYPHTGETFREPRFSYEEAREWVEKDVLDLQCHSYDMHQLESQGFSGRDGMLQKTGETGEEYRQALEADYQQFVEKRQGAVSTELMALAYPYGYCTEELDEMLEERFSVTITTQEHINLLRRGQEDTLRLLGRFNIEDGMTGQSIVERLDGLMNAG